MRVRILAVGFTVAVLAMIGGLRSAHAGCSFGITNVQDVTRNFSTGAAWRFTIAHDNCAGIRLTAVQYKRPGATAFTPVLASANIAEIHVPYNVGSPRFLDISSSTSGLGALAVTLSAAECAGGTLIDS